MRPQDAPDPPHHEWRCDGFLFSDDRSRLDLKVIHGFLSTCYWAANIPRELVEKSITHSLPFGVYDLGAPATPQVGFARVITDQATYAYLADVFIIEPYRGRGLSKRLIQHLLGHPHLQGLRRMGLMTRDANGLYAQFGFANMPDPMRYMEIRWGNRYPQSP